MNKFPEIWCYFNWVLPWNNKFIHPIQNDDPSYKTLIPKRHCKIVGALQVIAYAVPNATKSWPEPLDIRFFLDSTYVNLMCLFNSKNCWRGGSGKKLSDLPKHDIKFYRAEPKLYRVSRSLMLKIVQPYATRGKSLQINSKIQTNT